MAFNGLPAGEVQRIVRRTQSGASWLGSCRQSAHEMRRLATQSQSELCAGTARDAWLLEAAAWQAASFCMHLDPGAPAMRHAMRVRRLARAAYRRALAVDRTAGEAVQIPFEDRVIHGYLRRPPSSEPAPLIVLLNGLDSICEVEMHVFSTWLHSRGFVTLALDLPADSSSQPRRPLFAVERAVPAITRFIEGARDIRSDACGAFGVSFGGYLVARLLTSGKPFRCGVAVSPFASMSATQLPERIRAMLAWSFAAETASQLDELVASISLESLPPPAGRLLMFHMQEDQVCDERHARAFAEWGGASVELRQVAAEHVGTSAFHRWLPVACDWLQTHLR